jgi:hypothetical protein
MRFQLPDEQIVMMDRPFTLGDMQYSSMRALTVAQRFELGIIELPEPELVYTPMPAQIPQSVFPRQARLALLAADLLDAVEAAIAGASRADRITWEFAAEIRRDSPMIANLGAGLGITDEQIDQLFIAAAGIV